MAYYNSDDGSNIYQYGGQQEIDTSRAHGASSVQPSDDGYYPNHTDPHPQEHWQQSPSQGYHQPQLPEYAPQPFQGYSNPGTSDGSQRQWGQGDGLYAASAPTTVSDRSWNPQGQQYPPSMSQMTPQPNTFGYYQQPPQSYNGSNTASFAPVPRVAVPQQYYPQQPAYPPPDQSTIAPSAHDYPVPSTTQPTTETGVSQDSGATGGRLAMEVDMNLFTNDPIYRARILALQQQGAGTATGHDSTGTATSTLAFGQSGLAHAGPVHPVDNTTASNTAGAQSQGHNPEKNPFDDPEGELSDSDGWND